VRQIPLMQCWFFSTHPKQSVDSDFLNAEKHSPASSVQSTKRLRS
jgi:hypothetical protein